MPSSSAATRSSPTRSSGHSPVVRVLPGLLLSLAVGGAALGLSRVLPVLSPALVAIIVGVVAANSLLRRPVAAAALRPGLAVSSRRVLRIGIALLGLQLALGDVLALGPATLLLVVAVVGLGMGTGLLIGRALRMPTAQTVLISSGFSICGAAAVAATAGALAAARPPARAQSPTADDGRQDRPGARPSEDPALETQTATAIALVVVVGTLMIPLVPFASAVLGLTPAQGGTWAGASILEVAQVVAAGSLLGGEALGTAVLVKLARVLLLAPVIAILTAGLLRASAARGQHARGAARPPLVPMFILAFIAAVALRSLGIVPMPVLEAAAGAQTLLLAAAMFALGTGVRAELLRQVGGRPVVLAALLAVVVTMTGLLGAALVG